MSRYQGLPRLAYRLRTFSLIIIVGHTAPPPRSPQRARFREQRLPYAASSRAALRSETAARVAAAFEPLCWQQSITRSLIKLLKLASLVTKAINIVAHVCQLAQCRHLTCAHD
eukprot:6184982-Pleurochrysis_carterae.AAC.1